MFNDDDEKPTPATRDGEGLMSADDVKAAIGPILTDCVSYVDSVLSPERELATKYYNGDPFGNEEEGRSQVVLTELRDTVSGIIPDVMRLFFGPERYVEFLPKTAESVTNAKEQTDYIHFCFAERNSGFLESFAVLKDGLIRKIGIFKSWWDDSSDVRAFTLNNVTDDELTALAADDDVKLLGVTEKGMQDADDLPPAQEGQPAPQPQKLHTVHMTRSMPGRLRIKALPPEEFMYNRSARDTDTQYIVLAHRTRKSTSELLAMGISQDDIDSYGTEGSALLTNVEEIARRADHAGSQVDPATTKSNAMHEFTDAYIRLDVNGDGHSELRQMQCLGTGYQVVNGDGRGVPVDDHPFSLFIPDPEPHTLHGLSLFDRVGDLQLMKSNVFRAQADSLSMALFPRLSYVEGQANVNDILNVEIGAPIRMRQIGMVTPISMPYSGEMATPMLQYLDQVVERRTGRSKGAEGLDIDALQSTTSQGVDAAVSGSRAQTEMLARIFAEMTLKPMFRRLYRLVQQNQPEEYVKLRDRMTKVSPSAWEPELDVAVNVALGSTLIEKKLATLGAALAKQEQVLQLLGPQNPIVTLGMYAATLQRGVELGGFPDVESFFKSVADDWQPPQQAPQPTPEQTLAQAQIQVEQIRVHKELQIKEAELMLKQSAQQQDHERALAKDAADIALRKLEIEYKYKAGDIQQKFEIDTQRTDHMLEAHRMEVEHTLSAQDQAHAQSITEQGAAHEQGLAEDAQAHEQQMTEQQAAEPAGGSQ